MKQARWDFEEERDLVWWPGRARGQRVKGAAGRAVTQGVWVSLVTEKWGRAGTGVDFAAELERRPRAYLSVGLASKPG